MQEMKVLILSGGMAATKTRAKVPLAETSFDQLQETAEECESATPYAERPPEPAAPPLIPKTRQTRKRNLRKWWEELPTEERERLEEIEHPFVGGRVSNLLAIQHAAWEAAHPVRPPHDQLQKD